MNQTPPTPRRWTTGRVIALIVVVTLAAVLSTIGGCFVVLWTLGHAG